VKTLNIKHKGKILQIPVVNTLQRDGLSAEEGYVVLHKSDLGDPTGVLEYFDGQSWVQGAIQGYTGAPPSGGITGPAGPTGIQGEMGIQGETGLQGGTGLQGETGLPGSQGEMGAQGETGVQGETGAPGIQGVTGPQGLAADVMRFLGAITQDSDFPSEVSRLNGESRGHGTNFYRR